MKSIHLLAISILVLILAATFSGCATSPFDVHKPIASLSGNHENVITAHFTDGTQATRRLPISASWTLGPDLHPMVQTVGFSHDPLIGGLFNPVAFHVVPWAGIRFFRVGDFGLDTGFCFYGLTVGADWNVWDNTMVTAGILQPLDWKDFFAPWNPLILGSQVSVVP